MTTTALVLAHGPSLRLTSDQFEAAMAALEPRLRLTWEQFTDPARWAYIPDPDGRPYKAELVIRETAPETFKVNVWYAPDLRQDGRPSPHSHPWPFTSAIITGGYIEDRYALTPGGTVTADAGVEHPAGTDNHLDRDVFHEVVQVTDPGATLTVMRCGVGIRGSWGYLDPDTGRTRPQQPDPGFTARYRAANPHLH